MLELEVFLEGVDEPVGRLVRADNGAVTFAYSGVALPHPLSLALPVREEPFGDVEARSFFANLIFENEMRDQVIDRYGLAQDDVVGILYHLGSDCPGAISCVPVGAGPGKRPGNLAEDYEPLNPAGLTELMQSLADHRRMPHELRDPSPLAGVQGKVALTRLLDGRLALPRAGAPTTHILKVPRRILMHTVEQEHLTMQLMAEAQAHPVARTEVIPGDNGLRGLLIERFDRSVEGNRVSRLHQEDFCQALGLVAAFKYERHGLPPRAFTASAIGRLLAETDLPGPNRQAFLDITIVNLLLGNTDNHGKNHALIYRGGPRPALAPVYDVIPVLADDQVLHQLAFNIGAALMTDELSAADFETLATDLGMRRFTAGHRRQISKLTHRLVARIPEMRGPARKRIGDVIAEQARHVVAALRLEVEVPERDFVVINRPDQPRSRAS